MVLKMITILLCFTLFHLALAALANKRILELKKVRRENFEALKEPTSEGSEEEVSRMKEMVSAVLGDGEAFRHLISVALNDPKEKFLIRNWLARFQKTLENATSGKLLDDEVVSWEAKKEGKNGDKKEKKENGKKERNKNTNNKKESKKPNKTSHPVSTLSLREKNNKFFSGKENLNVINIDLNRNLSQIANSLQDNSFERFSPDYWGNEKVRIEREHPDHSLEITQEELEDTLYLLWKFEQFQRNKSGVSMPLNKQSFIESIQDEFLQNPSRFQITDDSSFQNSSESSHRHQIKAKAHSSERVPIVSLRDKNFEHKPLREHNKVLPFPLVPFGDNSEIEKQESVLKLGVQKSRNWGKEHSNSATIFTELPNNFYKPKSNLDEKLILNELNKNQPDSKLNSPETRLGATDFRDKYFLNVEEIYNEKNLPSKSLLNPLPDSSAPSILSKNNLQNANNLSERRPVDRREQPLKNPTDIRFSFQSLNHFGELARPPVSSNLQRKPLKSGDFLSTQLSLIESRESTDIPKNNFHILSFNHNKTHNLLASPLSRKNTFKNNLTETVRREREFQRGTSRVENKNNSHVGKLSIISLKSPTTLVENNLGTDEVALGLRSPLDKGITHLREYSPRTYFVSNPTSEQNTHRVITSVERKLNYAPKTNPNVRNIFLKDKTFPESFNPNIKSLNGASLIPTQASHPPSLQRKSILKKRANRKHLPTENYFQNLVNRPKINRPNLITNIRLNTQTLPLVPSKSLLVNSDDFEKTLHSENSLKLNDKIRLPNNNKDSHKAAIKPPLHPLKINALNNRGNSESLPQSNKEIRTFIEQGSNNLPIPIQSFRTDRILPITSLPKINVFENPPDTTRVLVWQNSSRPERQKTFVTNLRLPNSNSEHRFIVNKEESIEKNFELPESLPWLKRLQASLSHDRNNLSISSVVLPEEIKRLSISPLLNPKIGDSNRKERTFLEEKKFRDFAKHVDKDTKQDLSRFIRRLVFKEPDENKSIFETSPLLESKVQTLRNHEGKTLPIISSSLPEEIGRNFFSAIPNDAPNGITESKISSSSQSTLRKRRRDENTKTHFKVHHNFEKSKTNPSSSAKITNPPPRLIFRNLPNASPQGFPNPKTSRVEVSKPSKGRIQTHIEDTSQKFKTHPKKHSLLPKGFSFDDKSKPTKKPLSKNNWLSNRPKSENSPQTNPPEKIMKIPLITHYFVDTPENENRLRKNIAENFLIASVDNFNSHKIKNKKSFDFLGDSSNTLENFSVKKQPLEDELMSASRNRFVRARLTQNPNKISLSTLHTFHRLKQEEKNLKDTPLRTKIQPPKTSERKPNRILNENANSNLPSNFVNHANFQSFNSPFGSIGNRFGATPYPTGLFQFNIGPNFPPNRPSTPFINFRERQDPTQLFGGGNELNLKDFQTRVSESPPIQRNPFQQQNLLKVLSQQNRQILNFRHESPPHHVFPPENTLRTSGGRFSPIGRPPNPHLFGLIPTRSPFVHLTPTVRHLPQTRGHFNPIRAPLIENTSYINFKSPYDQYNIVLK